jgi:membrane peptidoglycan carboxypeptidase
VRIDYPRRGRTGVRRWLPSWRQWLLALGALVVVGLGTFVALYLTIDVPKPNDEAIAQASTVYFSDGTTELGSFGQANRTSVPLTDMPQSLRNAVLAAEDREFYQHGGFSPLGMVRAAWNDVTGGPLAGGSTITQQLVKNYYLTQDRTLSRKIDEFIVSIKIEQALSKDQILEDYLNTIYFGRGAYGVQAAAKAYFGVDAKQLTPAQGAVLASILRSPGYYNPETHLDRLQARWSYVLDTEVQQGWLTPAQRAAATWPKLVARSKASLLSGTSGYLVSYVEQELAARGISEDDLAGGGLKVTTTFDAKAQAAALQSVDEQRPKTKATGVRVGLVSVDPTTGSIVAMYGGADYGNPQYINDATQSIAQAGSTFKAFTLTAAIESGITLDSTWDGKSGRVFTDAYGSKTKPISNEDHVSYGRITLLRATEESVNTVFVDVENQPQVGAAKVIDAARRAGIPDDVAMQPTLSATLGVASPTALDMASAYGTLASGGLRLAPTSIKKVENAQGGILYQQSSPRPTRVFDQDVVATVDAALQKVVTAGTGSRVQAVGRPVAGKTGTTDSNLSAWFVGYTPQLSTSVVLFRTQADGKTRASLYGVGGAERVNGGSYPAAIFTQYMRQALKGKDVVPFPTPANLPTATPTPTTPSPTPSVVTPTPTPTATPTSSPSPTPTPTATPSPSGSPAASPTSSPAGPAAPAAPADGGAGAAAVAPGILTPGDRRR